MLSFKPTFSLSTFTFIKKLFRSSSLSAIRVVPSAYLRLLQMTQHSIFYIGTNRKWTTVSIWPHSFNNGSKCDGENLSQRTHLAAVYLFIHLDRGRKVYCSHVCPLGQFLFSITLRAILEWGCIVTAVHFLLVPIYCVESSVNLNEFSLLHQLS